MHDLNSFQKPFTYLLGNFKAITFLFKKYSIL
jgi:hypothetical protein